MAEPLFDDHLASFCVAYTKAIMAWNNAENAAKDILNALSAGSVGATIAIHELGNVSLVGAINTVTDFLRSLQNELATERADHVSHFATGLDVLRAYRNYYVHTMRGLGKSSRADAESDKNPYVGLLYGLDVKGGYRYTHDDLDMQKLSKFTKHCMDLEQYGAAISRHLAHHSQNALAKLAAQTPPPLSSLQKPLWPEKLKKTRHNLITPLPTSPSPPIS